MLKLLRLKTDCLNALSYQPKKILFNFFCLTENLLELTGQVLFRMNHPSLNLYSTSRIVLTLYRRSR